MKRFVLFVVTLGSVGAQAGPQSQFQQRSKLNRQNEHLLYQDQKLSRCIAAIETTCGPIRRLADGRLDIEIIRNQALAGLAQDPIGIKFVYASLADGRAAKTYRDCYPSEVDTSTAICE